VTKLKSVLVKSALVASMAVGVAAATAATASADVACNRYGECWRVADRYDYPAGIGVTFHDDAWWAGHPTGNWRWREGHDRDRGYWRNGVWISF
jgi:hypothetical protein